MKTVQYGDTRFLPRQHRYIKPHTVSVSVLTAPSQMCSNVVLWYFTTRGSAALCGSLSAERERERLADHTAVMTSKPELSFIKQKGAGTCLLHHL